MQNEHSQWSGIDEKTKMETAIVKKNERKYQQSFHTPFMVPPLVLEIGFKGASQTTRQLATPKRSMKVECTQHQCQLKPTETAEKS
jgi:hypothetical protein